MYGLEQLLRQEYNKMLQFEAILQKRLQNTPDGSLRISKTGGIIQYYRQVPETPQKNGKYLSTGDFELAKALAQKSYDEKLYRLVKRRIAQLGRLSSEYLDSEVERLYQSLNEERQKLVEPIQPTYEQLLMAWEQEPYLGKDFFPDTPVILTERGERVRSKSEKIMADYFFHHGISYKYEKPLYLRGFGTVYPDFTFLSQKTYKEQYWEHHGRMDDPEYSQKAIRKIKTYEDNGILLGQNLIVTFETMNDLISTQEIELLVNRYLLP